MKKSQLSGFVLLLGIELASGGLATAQDNASAATQSNSANKKASNAKPKKTWTEDDVAALHSPADSYQKQAQVQSAGDVAKNPASAQETSALNEPPRDKPPLLSDPKTVESADNMVAWEDRDIAAQEEFVARLKTQLETAAPEDRDHLENLIVE